MDPQTSNPLAVETFSVLDDDSLLVAGFDGTNGILLHTDNGGFFYHERTIIGSQALDSLALSPYFEDDGTILAGNTSGWVYISRDRGQSFLPVPVDAGTPPLSGSITVGFDAGFNENGSIYAASSTADEGIFRFRTGSDTAWQMIDASLPAGATIVALQICPEGVLYATNSDANGGLERSLNPAFSPGPDFETVTSGLTTGAVLYGLWLNGQQMWSINTATNTVVTMQDSLTQPPIPVAPEMATAGAGNILNHGVTNVRLEWSPIPGATSYRWQLDYETDFSSVPTGFEGTTSATEVRLPTLEPATTYYWRTRAEAPANSAWSPKASFTTTLDTEIQTLSLLSPGAASGAVAVKPVFEWLPVAGATAYEILVAEDEDFSRPVIVRVGDYALRTTAWQSEVNLDYDTTYFWKVRALSSTSSSAWSPVSSLHTTAAPVAELPPDIPPAADTFPSQLGTGSDNPLPAIRTPQAVAPGAATPSPPQPALPQPASAASSLEPWIPYLVGALLCIMVLMLIVMLAMTLAIRRR
ncbi:hypothetical protein ACFLW1_01975 [Chloroflexota bacterium]